MIKDTHKYNILVVEDNEKDFILIEEHLRERIAAPLVICAINAMEAEERIKTAVIPFDVILLDLFLPDISGRELIDRILQLAGDTPIVILTSFSDFNFSVIAISEGISDYISKDDLNAANLYKAIVYSIERKKMISDLQESEKRYSDLFNLSPQPKWIFDNRSFCFLQVNKAALDLFGYSENEMLHMSLSDIGENEHEGAKNFKNIIADHTERIHYKYHKKSGDAIDLEIYSHPIIHQGKTAYAVTAIDVTERLQYDNKITLAIIKTQEKERIEMGRELHDNVCQILAAARMKLDMLMPSVSEDKIILFKESIDNLKLASDEIRNLSHRLAPAFYDISDLREAFFKLVKSYSPVAKMKVAVNFDKNIMKYPIRRGIQLNMYRILQEQVGNIMKYAHATEMKIDVSVIRRVLKMKISDNGIGFNPDHEKNGIGLLNIKKRAELFSGNAEIISSPGKGCTVTVSIPIKAEKSL